MIGFFHSLRKHPFLLALCRWGRFAKRPQRRRARRNGCFRGLFFSFTEICGCKTFKVVNCKRTRETGEQGAQGATRETRGNKGTKENKGKKGEQEEQGEQGEQGNKGEQGGTRGTKE